MIVNWRKFNFFDKGTAQDEKLNQFFATTEVTCVTSGRGHIIFGDNRGMVHVMDRSFNVVSFLAFQNRVNHLKHHSSTNKSNYLVCIGDDQPYHLTPSTTSPSADSQHPSSESTMEEKQRVIDPTLSDIVKIYNLDKIDVNASISSIEQACFVKSFRLFHKKAYQQSNTLLDALPQQLNNLSNVVLGAVGSKFQKKKNSSSQQQDKDDSSHERLHNISPSAVTCVDVNSDFTCIALGLGSGFILLIQGDISRGRALIRALPLHPKLVAQQQEDGFVDRITGVLFTRKSNPQHEKFSTLYVTMPTKVLYYTIFAPQSTTKPFVNSQEMPHSCDDDRGCEMNCYSLQSQTNQLIIANKEGAFFYSPDGKGECFGLEGKKIAAEWFKNYFVMVHTELNKSNSGVQQVISIFDLKNKFIAFKFASEKMQVTHVIQEWQSLFFLVKVVDGVTPTSPQNQNSSQQQLLLLQLEEKDTQTKLEMLLKKNLYKAAIELVYSHQLDYNYLIDIFKQYGDHLYSKKDYDGAMQEYLRTIGRLEPSYVIGLFLDGQRIHHLITYLEALHQQNVATTEHTTLLLNCYTKLKQDAITSGKLDLFIRTQQTLQYDIETAIKVCRQANYKDHALWLAKKHRQTEWILKLYMEDFGIPNNALRVMEQSLNREGLLSYIKSYGNSLMKTNPLEMTNVCVRLCTQQGYTPIPWFEVNRQVFPLSSPMNQARMERIKNRLQKRQQFVSQVDELIKIQLEDEKVMLEQLQQTNSQQQQQHFIKAEEIMGIFSNSPIWLMLFLECVIVKQPLQSKIVYNTLIELYLQMISNERKTESFMLDQYLTVYPQDFQFYNVPSMAMHSSSTVPASQQQSLLQPQHQPQPTSTIGKLSSILTPIGGVVEKLAGGNNSASTVNSPIGMMNSSHEENELLAWNSSELEKIGQYDHYEIYYEKQSFHSKSFEEKIIELLDKTEEHLIDAEHVLALVQSHQFKEGILKMYEKLGLHYDILQYYMELKQHEQVYQAVCKYGQMDHNMWIQVLHYFAQEEAQEILSKCLTRIDKENLLPPLLVVQIVSKYPHVTLQTISSYVTSKIAKEQSLIQKDLQTIKENSMEITKMKNEIYELQTSAFIFQLSNCSLCNSALDLPAVHFLCGHSFHQRCVVDQDMECQFCMRKNRDVLSSKKRFEEASTQHELFFKQLSDKKQEGFSVMADYFGRNIFKPWSVKELKEMHNDDIYYEEMIKQKEVGEDGHSHAHDSHHLEDEEEEDDYVSIPVQVPLPPGMMNQLSNTSGGVSPQQATLDISTKSFIQDDYFDRGNSNSSNRKPQSYASDGDDFLDE